MRKLICLMCSMALVLGVSASVASASPAQHTLLGHPAKLAAGPLGVSPSLRVSASRTGGSGLAADVLGTGIRPLGFGATSQLARGLKGVVVGDDNIPGSELTTSPVTGSLDATSDVDDVYWFYLEQGAEVTFDLTGDPGNTFRAVLFAPDATDVGVSPALQMDPAHLDYVAPTSGYYYVDMWANGSSGNYSLSWNMYMSPNDDIPGVAISASPVSEWLDAEWDGDDVYRIPLRAGDTLNANLDIVSAYSSPDFDLDLLLYGPSSTTLYPRPPYAAISAHDGNPEAISYVAPVTGDYYLDVAAWSGWGPSYLTYTRIFKPALTRTPSASKVTVKRKGGKAKFTLGATMSDGGAKVASHWVYLQKSGNGKSGWKTYVRIKTNGSGRVAATITAKKKGTLYYRWYAPASANTYTTQTGTQKVTVK